FAGLPPSDRRGGGACVACGGGGGAVGAGVRAHCRSGTGYGRRAGRGAAARLDGGRRAVSIRAVNAADLAGGDATGPRTEITLSTRRRLLSRGAGAATVGCIVAISIAAYLPSFHAGFIGLDDNAYVTANDSLRSGAGLRRIWLDPTASPQYYPIVFSAFWL